MKKIFLLLISVVALSAFVSCDDKPTTADQLPSKAKAFLDTYFPGIDILSVIKDDGTYDVNLVDGTDVDFRLNGNWKKVDCHGRLMPTGFYPANIDTYVAANCPGQRIEEIEFENNRYKVGLSDEYGWETDDDLLFDKNGNFIGFDD
jgi:hypothetical protein